MKKNVILTAILGSAICFCVLGQNIRAQTAESKAASPEKSEKTDERSKRAVKKNVIKNMWFPPSKRDYEAIAITNDDFNRYADFLKIPNTGLIRLHDATKCVSSARNIVNVEEPCPSNFILGKATSYSFRTKKYRTPLFSDLQFSNRAFHAVGVNSQGILTEIGDIELAQISASSDALKTLIEFAPSTDSTKASLEFQRFAKGVRAGNYTYRKSLPVKENETYVLRAIAYKGKVIQQRGLFKINLLDDDRRDDVVIAFRIIRFYEDGSVNILWKEIERKPAPKLTFEPQNKREK